MADLASAIVAGLSGIAGAAVGGFVTYKVAMRQATAANLLQQQEWEREDVRRRRRLYARFVAAASQVMANWLREPTTTQEADRAELGQDRDRLYRELDRLASMVRITATSEVRAKAEVILTTIRETQSFARTTAGRSEASLGWARLEAKFADARDAFVGEIRRRRRGQPAAT